MILFYKSDWKNFNIKFCEDKNISSDVKIPDPRCISV